MTGSDQLDLLNVFRALQTRRHAFSWNAVRTTLGARFSLPTATGWDNLIQKYQALSPTHKHVAQGLAAAKETYKVSTHYGTRAVTIFDVGQSVATTLAKKTISLLDSTSIFCTTYPYPVDGATLERAPFNGAFVARTLSASDDSVRMIACSKRAYKERNTINVGSLSQSTVNDLDGYDEVIGIKSGFVQAFDSIVVRPKDGTVEIHIDMCSPSPLSDADLTQYTAYFVSILNDLVPPPANVQKYLYRPRNLFGCVQKFYDDPAGNVISLGHATGTNSVKEERMRKKSDDLRKEPFHQKGLAAIASTDIYAIKKAWPGELTMLAPTVSLPGKFSQAGAIDARIDFAIIENCSSKQDFMFAVAQLR
ncbi:hypothetical protein [Achromobacter insuavis]|uniref:hypothetical protein n=3 Tax=Bacteria TaxID=2 RepID=UPI0029D8CD2F|nr:hypothetical protein [Achromobacter sp.]MCG2601486.1 hypothetical protein [Achromobacter sp.]